MGGWIPPLGAVIGEVARNALMGLPHVAGWRGARGRTALAPDAALLDRYCYGLLDRVIAHTGSLAGKAVLEIGPGDNLVAALGLLAAAAASVTTLDRFPGDYAGAQARRWYALLANDWARRYPRLDWPPTLDPFRFPNGASVRAIVRAVEDVAPHHAFDIVCSFAAGQHVRDVRAFARVTRAALVAGGRAVHLVDFGGMRWHRDDDPLRFRRIPEWLWRAMGSNRGYANRVPFAAFLQMLTSAGLRVWVPETRAWPSGEVREALFVCERA